MGFKVGMPFKKLSFNPSKKGNAAPVHAYALEMMEERHSKSVSLDRTLSNTNVYFTAEHSGQAIADAMYEECEAYSAQQQANGKRKLRSDAVVGMSYIIKPPMEVTATWSRAYTIKFFEDAHAVLEEMGEEFPECQVFRKDNVRASVLHFDEWSPHGHDINSCKTNDGRICGKDCINLKMFATVNREFPKRMRELGYDVEDCEMYEPEEAEKMGEEERKEYKAYHKAKNQKHGRDVNKYINDKTNENLEESEQVLVEANALAEQNIENAYNMVCLANEANEAEASAKAEAQQGTAADSWTS